MKFPLSNGEFTLIDEEDFLLLNRWSWHLVKNGYAFRSESVGKRDENGRRKSKPIYMHRFILRAPIGKEVDHINGDRLDNRKKNLRICSSYQNRCNQRKTRGTSQFKGVSFRADRKKWVAQIGRFGKKEYLGLFKNEEEAARAYNKAAKEMFGKYAKVNKMKRKK